MIVSVVGQGTKSMIQQNIVLFMYRLFGCTSCVLWDIDAGRYYTNLIYMIIIKLPNEIGFLSEDLVQKIKNFPFIFHYYVNRH